MAKQLQKERDEDKQERDQAKQEEKEAKEETDRLKKDNKWLLSAIKDYETYQPVNMKYMPSMKHQAKTIPKKFIFLFEIAKEYEGRTQTPNNKPQPWSFLIKYIRFNIRLGILDLK